MAIVHPTIPENVKPISLLRKASADLISAAIDDDEVKVHSTWKLRADLQKSISLFKREDGKIHGWMVGNAAMNPVRGQNGGYEYIGGRKVNRTIKIICWGFFDYTLFDAAAEKTSLAIVEDECELIGAYFAANPRLGLDGETWIREVQPFDVENLDIHSVSEGFDVHIAQCGVNVIVSRY